MGSFVLNEEGWCPLLNEKGLCEVCLTLGEDSLSEVCTEYPRFTTEYPKTREKVLCLSCGEVGRIVFSDTEQIGFDEQILSEDYDEYEWEDGDDELAEKLESVKVACNRTASGSQPPDCRAYRGVSELLLSDAERII